MKNKTFSKNGMKMIINSGYKLFDNQTNLITSGAVIANTQLSCFIRPFNETECNGLTFEKGHLMNFDIEWFKGFKIPGFILDILKNESRKYKVYLYMFFTTDKQGRKDPFGWVLTGADDHLITTFVDCRSGAHYMKRLNAILEVTDYIVA